jgi:peptide/nickel transport system substrate-binding protein
MTSKRVVLTQTHTKGRCMRRVSLSWLMPALLISFALIAAGCGGDDGDSGSKSNNPNPSGADIGEGKQGGAVTFLAAADVDYLDPGQTYYTFGYMVQYAVNRPLYSFEPDDAETPVPDLADGDPEISEDNKTITVTLKKGVKFSPPVNREVTSEDVKYGIERAFTTNVPSGYSTSYFAEIEGAPKAPVKIGKLKPFSGLDASDPSKLVIKLTKPVAPRMAAALVMPITVPVPKEYASEFDKENPSTYDQHVVFTGPYMVKNDAEGKLTGRDPGKKIELVRNPNWDKGTDYRPAFLDTITIEEGNDDLTVASRRTLSGQKLMCCDSGQPPISILKRALTRFKDQLGRVPGGGTRWIALNTTVKPFDNINVRKAVIAGFDRNALRLTRGGEEVGPIAQSYIPPGIPGHEESEGEQGFTEFDWMQKPAGDPELSKKYMLEAKKDGVPVSADGKYAGKEKILTIATNADPGKGTATVAQNEFEKLGFTLNFRNVPQDTLYTKFCGVPERKVAICPNVGWFKDFQDAESMLQPTFAGKAIKPAGNVNWSQIKNQKIDDAMDKAALLPLGDERNQAWADINKMIVAEAPGIPYVWDDSFQLASKDLNAVMNGYFTTWDLSFSSLK